MTRINLRLTVYATKSSRPRDVQPKARKRFSLDECPESLRTTKGS
jgi:hypothetical protein